MLIKITTENFRGDSWTQDLTGFDIITGGNFVGKTSRILAITFGIYGKLPGFPSRETPLYAALCKEPGDGEIKVVLEFQNKEVVRIERTLSRKREKVTRKLDVAFRDGSDLKQLAKSTEGYKGTQNLILLALKPALEAFSLNVFRSDTKSGPEREKELLALFGELTDGDSSNDRAVLMAHLQQTNVGDEETREGVIADAVDEWDIAKDWPEALEDVEKKLREMKNDFAADRRVAENSQKELATMPLDETVGNLAELESDLTLMNSRKDVINKQTGEEETRSETHEGWVEQCDQLRAQIEVFRKSVDGLNEEKAAYDEADIQRRTLSLESLKTDHKVASDEYDASNEAWKESNRCLQVAKVDADASQKKVEALEVSRQSLEDGEVMICQFTQEPCGIITADHLVPLLSSAVKARDEAVEWKSSLALDLSETTQGLQQAEQKRDALKDDVGIAEGNYKTVTDRVLVLDEEIEGAMTSFDDEEAKLQKLKDTRPPLGEVDVTLLTAELEGLTANIKVKDDIKENTIRKQERETQTLELGIKIEEAEMKNEVLKDLLVKVKDVRKQFKSTLESRIRDTLSKLKSVAGEITFRDGDFVADDVPFCSLSGSQQKVMGMSIKLGFMALRDSAYRLLFVDDAENIDKSHWAKFSHALEEIRKDGLVDNFIAAGITLATPAGAKEWKLDKGE